MREISRCPVFRPKIAWNCIEFVVTYTKRWRLLIRNMRTPAVSRSSWVAFLGWISKLQEMYNSLLSFPQFWYLWCIVNVDNLPALRRIWKLTCWSSPGTQLASNWMPNAASFFILKSRYKLPCWCWNKTLHQIPMKFLWFPRKFYFKAGCFGIFLRKLQGNCAASALRSSAPSFGAWQSCGRGIWGMMRRANSGTTFPWDFAK